MLIVRSTALQVAMLVVALSEHSSAMKPAQSEWSPVVLPLIRQRLRRFQGPDLALILLHLASHLGCPIGNRRVVRKLLLPACRAALASCMRPSDLTSMAVGLAAHACLSEGEGSMLGQRWREGFLLTADWVCSESKDPGEVQRLVEATECLLHIPISFSVSKL